MIEPTMNPRRFRARATKRGKGAVIPLPFDPNDAWSAKDKHYVDGTVQGYRIRASLEAKEGAYHLSLGPAWVRDNPLPDAELDVELAPEGPQVGLLAEDIQTAFAAAPEARRLFESLATFYRKGFVEPIEEAKRPETRAARIIEMIALLNAGKREK